MKSKFWIFNIIVFFVFFMLFSFGSNSMESSIDYVFSGNSWLNPVSEEIYNFTGIILQGFSAIGVLIQLIFVNIKLLRVEQNL